MRDLNIDIWSVCLLLRVEVSAMNPSLHSTQPLTNPNCESVCWMKILILHYNGPSSSLRTQRMRSNLSAFVYPHRTTLRKDEMERETTTKATETCTEFGIVFGSKKCVGERGVALSMSKLLPARKERERREEGMVMWERGQLECEENEGIEERRGTDNDATIIVVDCSRKEEQSNSFLSVHFLVRNGQQSLLLHAESQNKFENIWNR